MTTIDWYRRTTWTEQDRVEFDQRLARAREKTQYLRIQAWHLAEVGLHGRAIELLSRLIDQYSDATHLFNGKP